MFALLTLLVSFDRLLGVDCQMELIFVGRIADGCIVFLFVFIVGFIDMQMVSLFFIVNTVVLVLGVVLFTFFDTPHTGE